MSWPWEGLLDDVEQFGWGVEDLVLGTRQGTQDMEHALAHLEANEDPSVAAPKKHTSLRACAQVALWQLKQELLDGAFGGLRMLKRQDKEWRKAEKRCEIQTGSTINMEIRWEKGDDGVAMVFIPGPSRVEKKPKPTSSFTKYFCVVAALKTGSAASEEVGLAFTTAVSKKEVKMKMHIKAAQRLQEACDSPDHDRLVLVPLAQFQFAGSMFNGIQAFAELDAAQRTPTLMCFLDPKLNPFPTWDKVQSYLSSESLPGLNSMQQLAMAQVAATPHGFVAIQGPPGTGKSHLISQALLPLLVERQQKRVLVLCLSNAAVDQLFDKLSPGLKQRSGRYGCASNVKKSVRDAEDAFQDSYAGLAGKDIVVSPLYQAGKDAGPDAKRMPHLGGKFDVWILDEASQVKDSHIMCCLGRAGHNCPQKVLLVGDHRQLPPIVPACLEKQGFGTSFMERLVDCKAANPQPRGTGADRIVTHVMLEEQRRMAPTIRQLVSSISYDDKLQDGPGMVNTISPSILILDVKSYSEYDSSQRSFYNTDEALAVAAVHKALEENLGNILGTQPGARPDPSELIGVITTHIAQRAKLQEMIAGDEQASRRGNYGFSKMDGTSEELTGNQQQLSESIKTVDACQGWEREIILYSPCGARRAANKRLLNVAMSRARQLLVVICNLKELKGGSALWEKVEEYARSMEGSSQPCCAIRELESAGHAAQSLLDTLQRLPHSEPGVAATASNHPVEPPTPAKCE